MDDLPQYVTLVGSGFFQWEETVCYYGSQSTSDIIFVNTTHLQCKIASVGMSTQFSLSLSMDGGLRRVGSANLTVFDRAPTVTSAKFSDTAAEILVSFNKEVEFVGSETCPTFFENATVVKLGERPDCFLATTQELEIILRLNPTILVNDNLMFKDNVFKARGEPFSKFLSGSSSVSFPDSPLSPVPEITGPETISSCGNLTLSSFQSFGGGGRPLIFSWSLTSPNSGADVTAINNILGALSGDADRIHIPGTVLEAGKTYEFRLGVANFLSPSSFENVTHSVLKAADPVPSLTLSSFIDLDTGEFYVSEELYIKARAVVAPCANDTKVNFMWTVTCTDASAQQNVRDSSSFQNTKPQATIIIAKGVLSGDVTCKFNVTGSMNYNPSVKSSVAVDIRALPSPLVPAIDGGNRQIGRDSGDIRLDALTRTVDPDRSSLALSCSWRCQDQNNGFCYSAVSQGQLIFSSVSGCRPTVQSRHFTAGNIYQISVDVSKGSRSASTSIYLTVVEGNPPDVWVGQAYIKISVNERPVLEGFYETNNLQPTSVEWSCVQEQGFAYVDLSSFTPIQDYFPGNESYALLTLPAGLLKKGSKYKFKLTVNDGSKDGIATMVVEVRSGPTSGSLSVDKNTVEALVDKVTMSATQWTADAEAFPLLYAFGDLVEHGVCEVWGPPSDIPEWRDIMPAGSGPNNILTLCVIVEDKFESIAMATLNITSNPPNAAALTPVALDNLFENAFEDKLSGNLDAALSTVRNIAGTVQSSNGTSDELKRNISQKAQEFIVEYLDSAVVGEDNALPLLSALVKTDATAAGNSSTMAQAAEKIIEGLGDNPLNDDQAEDFLKWIGDLAGDSFEDNDESFKDSVVDIFDELGDNLGAELVLGDPPREVSDDRLGRVTVKVSTLQNEMAVSSKPGAPTFDPGEALAAQFSTPRQCGDGRTCSGVLLKLVQFEDNLISEDPNNRDDNVEIYNSQVIGLELKDPVSKTPLTVQGLSRPLRLTFYVGALPEGKEAQCKFFDEAQKVWVSIGMTAVGPENGTLICESTHATFFAPSQDKTNATTTASPATTVGAKPAEEKDYTGAIVGGVIGGIVLIVLVIVGVWWCSKKKKESTGRVSPETPPGAHA